MNLNSETNYTTLRNDVNSDTGHFGQYPKATVSRSRYKVPFRNTFTCNASRLIPFFWKYTMPNMTDSVDTSAVIRMQPTVHSPMSNVYADVYYFFVPLKDLWTSDANGGLKEFFGETRGQYTPAPLSTYQIPQVTFPSSTGFSAKSVADFLGVPTGVDPANDQTISALPFRAYAAVWNAFFRDENLSPEALVYTGSTTQTGQTVQNDPLNTASLGGDLLPVCRPHDMLGSCLPFPQKGDPLDSAIPIDADYNAVLPVRTGAVHDKGAVPLYWASLYPSDSVLDPEYMSVLGVFNASETSQSRKNLQTVSDFYTESAGDPSDLSWMKPSNLVLNFGDAAFGTAITTINSLRTSVALQHYFEALARGGSRYFEVISSLYGTTIDPLMLDRPMYLGGKRVPISITNVIQNTPTGAGTTGLGSVAGYSCTSDFDNSFSYSYSQHGITLGVLCIRSEKQYQNGLDRNWKLKDRLEFYTPGVFDGLGEMEVLNSDIYLNANDTAGDNDAVFGYQEAYYWERYRPSVIAGEFRSNYSTTLDSWHLADNYSDNPVLDGSITEDDGKLELGWIYDNTDVNLDRILQVSSKVSDQFYVDIYVDDTVVSPLPVYSIPGVATL